VHQVGKTRLLLRGGTQNVLKNKKIVHQVGKKTRLLLRGGGTQNVLKNKKICASSW
jgi:hypothetical protein